RPLQAGVPVVAAAVGEVRQASGFPWGRLERRVERREALPEPATGELPELRGSRPEDRRVDECGWRIPDHDLLQLEWEARCHAHRGVPEALADAGRHRQVRSLSRA